MIIVRHGGMLTDWKSSQVSYILSNSAIPSGGHYFFKQPQLIPTDFMKLICSICCYNRYGFCSFVSFFLGFLRQWSPEKLMKQLNNTSAASIVSL